MRRVALVGSPSPGQEIRWIMDALREIERASYEDAPVEEALTPLADVDIAGATVLTAPAVDDTMPIYDTSASENKQIALSNLLKVVGALAAETAPAADDGLPIFDTSAGTTDLIALSDLFKVIGLLTAETAPATDDGFALFDTSAGTADFITLANALKVVSALTEDTAPDGAADFILTIDATDGLPKKTLLHRATKYKVGSFTRDLTTASGTQAVTGVGFKPKALILLGGIAGAGATHWSVGFSDVSSNVSISNLESSAVGVAQAAIAIVIGPTATDTQTATITSMDADGFTVSWTKLNSPTGTGTAFYLVLR